MRTSTWDKERFTALLEDLRTRAGLEHPEMAAMANLSRSQFNRWSRGENRPSFEPLAAFVQSISARYPDLREPAIRLFESAGYGDRWTALSEQATRAMDYSVADALRADGNLERTAIEQLRGAAAAGGKSLGEILVERGLADPSELRISDQVRGDAVVRKILALDLPDDQKDELLKDVAELRRQTFRDYGIDD